MTSGIGFPRSALSFFIMHDIEPFGRPPISLSSIALSLPTSGDHGNSGHVLPAMTADRATVLSLPGATAEAVLRDGGQRLHLTLREGDPAALHRLALDIHASAPVSIWSDPATPAGAHKAGGIELARGAAVAEGFEAVVMIGLAHLLANRSAALSGEAEGVRRMRVAVRRLRAALVLFEPLLEPHAAARFQSELRRV